MEEDTETMEVSETTQENEETVEEVQETVDEVKEAGQQVEEVYEGGGQAAKPGLSIAPVRMTSEIGEDGQKKVPGIKIIGLSSELKKAMAGEEGSVEDFEEDPEDDDESEEDEEEDEDEDEEEAEEDDESSVEATPVPMKTPKHSITLGAEVSFLPLFVTRLAHGVTVHLVPLHQHR